MNDKAVQYFTDMLGPAEAADEEGNEVQTGKIGHVTEIEISERASGKVKTSEEGEPEVFTTFIKLFKEKLGLNKPKKGKKGKGKKGGKKKKK